MWLPSATVKLAPSGWVMSMVSRPVRKVTARRRSCGLSSQRPDADVVDVVDRHLVEVDVDHETIDRSGIAVVARLFAIEKDAAHASVTVLDRFAHVSRWPGVYLKLGGVGNAALGYRRHHPRISPDGLHDRLDLTESHLWVLTGDGVFGDQGSGGHRDDEFVDLALAGAIEPDLEVAFSRPAFGHGQAAERCSVRQPERSDKGDRFVDLRSGQQGLRMNICRHCHQSTTRGLPGRWLSGQELGCDHG